MMNLILDFGDGGLGLDAADERLDLSAPDERFRSEESGGSRPLWLEPPVSFMGFRGRLCLYPVDGGYEDFSFFFDDGLLGAGTVREHPVARAIESASGVPARGSGRSLAEFVYTWGRLRLMYDYKTTDLNLIGERRR